MQNKGFVKVFALLLTLVCVFYLSFSFVTTYQMNPDRICPGTWLHRRWFPGKLHSERRGSKGLRRERGRVSGSGTAHAS